MKTVTRAPRSTLFSGTRKLVRFAPFLCAASSALLAQTTTTKEEGNMDPDEAITLSVFTVTTEKNTGYDATNTLSGTRINTAIENTPIAISQLTREFLNDIGATDASKAVEYALNASVDTSDATGNSLAFNPFQYRIRGFGGGTNARNYFKSEFLSESYNIDYLELGRGPNSVLFGIASPGGSYNASTKKAGIGENFDRFRVRFGSFNERRTELDVARTVGKSRKLAVRVNALVHDADGYYDFEYVKRYAAMFSATYRPFKQTTIRLELERANFEENRARPFPVGNRFQNWANYGSNYQVNPTDRPSYTSALYSSGSGNGIYFFPDATGSDNAVAFSGNYFRTSTNTQIRGGTGNDVAGVLDTSIIPRNANLLGKGGVQDSRQAVAGVFVEQNIGKSFSLEGAYYFQSRHFVSGAPLAFNDNDVYVDVSRNIPVFDPITGALTGYKANPNLGKYLVRGTYTDIAMNERQHNYRLTASYDLNLGFLGHHRLAGLLQNTFFSRDTIQDREVNVAADRQYVSLVDSRNAIIRANYLDFSSSDLEHRGISDATSDPIKSRLYGASTYGVESGRVKVNWTAAENTVNSEVLATQSSFWKDRIWLTAGVRHDTVKNNTASSLRDPTTYVYTGVVYDKPDDLNVSDTTSSYGAVFHVTKWLSVYGNISDNFNTQGNAVLFGETGSNKIAGNTKGKGRDGGLRAKLFDGKINLSLGYYNTEQVDQYFYAAGTYAAVMNNIWATLEPTRPLLSGNELQTIGGEGVEFELTANPTKNLRLTFNFARTSSYSQQRDYNYVRSYMEKYKSTWLSSTNATRALSTTTYGTTVQEAWNTLQSQLATDTATNGRMPFAFRALSANVFAKYSFSSGLLRGFAIGAGGNWRGPMLLAYANNDSNQKVTGYEQIFVNALLSYDFKPSKKIQTSVQLNVDNVFGFDDLYPRKYFWYGDAQGPSILYQYVYQVRKWSLSASFKF
jgi:outer membrane receptor protein involved in Fe transport